MVHRPLEWTWDRRCTGTSRRAAGLRSRCAPRPHARLSGGVAQPGKLVVHPREQKRPNPFSDQCSAVELQRFLRRRWDLNPQPLVPIEVCLVFATGVSFSYTVPENSYGRFRGYFTKRSTRGFPFAASTKIKTWPTIDSPSGESKETGGLWVRRESFLDVTATYHLKRVK